MRVPGTCFCGEARKASRVRASQTMPLARIAPPSEVVETVQYLASDAASFVTGQVIGIDGGRGLTDAGMPPAH